jgi:hypothetical protein
MSWCAIASAADKPVIASAAQQQVGARGGCEIVIYSMTNCSGCTDLKNEIFIDGDPGKGPKPGYACNTVTYKDCGDRGLKCRSSLPEGCRTPDPKNPGSKVLQFPCSVVNGAPHRGYSPANGNTPIQDSCACDTPTPTPVPSKKPGNEVVPPKTSPGANPCPDTSPYRCVIQGREGYSCCIYGCDSSNKVNGCLSKDATPTPIPPRTAIASPPKEECPNGVCSVDGGTPNPFATLLPPIIPTQGDCICPDGQKCDDTGVCAPTRPGVLPPYADTSSPSNCPPAVSCDNLKCDPSKMTCESGKDERGCEINVCKDLPPSVLVTPTTPPTNTTAPTPEPSIAPPPAGGRCSSGRLTNLCEAPNKGSWTCCLPSERCTVNGQGLATCQP